MLEFFANNPVFILSVICCFWPGAVGVLCYMIGRYGVPVAWRGWKRDV